jgi:hypothetical protein
MSYYLLYTGEGEGEREGEGEGEKEGEVRKRGRGTADYYLKLFDTISLWEPQIGIRDPSYRLAGVLNSILHIPTLL